MSEFFITLETAIYCPIIPASDQGQRGNFQNFVANSAKIIPWKTLEIKVMTRDVIKNFCIFFLFNTRETQLKLLLVWIASVYPGPGWSREFEESVPNLNLFRWNCSTLFSLCDHYSLVVITCPWTFAVNWINNKFSHPFLVIYFNIFFIICFTYTLLKMAFLIFKLFSLTVEKLLQHFFDIWNCCKNYSK